MNNTSPALKIRYTNYKGETSERLIAPKSVEYACTPNITEPEWLLRAIDLEKNAERLFVMKNMTVLKEVPFDRHFCVTVYVKKENDFLMLRHKKLQKWLPPGGHVDANELPDEAATREVFEETGLRVKLVGPQPSFEGSLTRPLGVQLNPIVPGQHEHIDIVYLSTPTESDELVVNDVESDGLKWFNREEILSPDFDTFPSIKEWVKELSREKLT